jgi:hypothetical protein
VHKHLRKKLKYNNCGLSHINRVQAEKNCSIAVTKGQGVTYFNNRDAKSVGKLMRENKSDLLSTARMLL